MPAPAFSGATGRSRHAEDRQEADLLRLEEGLELSAFDDESPLPPLVSTDRSSLVGADRSLPGSPPRTAWCAQNVRMNQPMVDPAEVAKRRRRARGHLSCVVKP